MLVYVAFLDIILKQLVKLLVELGLKMLQVLVRVNIGVLFKQLQADWKYSMPIVPHSISNLQVQKELTFIGL